MLDISKIESNNPGSKNVFALIKAIATINIIWAKPTVPIPIVFPSTIVFGLVDVTRVSIIFEVFSVVIELDT